MAISYDYGPIQPIRVNPGGSPGQARLPQEEAEQWRSGGIQLYQGYQGGPRTGGSQGSHLEERNFVKD